VPPRFLLTPRRARCRARIAPLACFAAAATCDIIANESSSPLLPRPAPRHAAAQVNSLASKDLKRLFRYREDTLSDTHDQLKCTECKGLMAITADSAADANDMTPERQAACAELLEEVRQCETPRETLSHKHTHTRTPRRGVAAHVCAATSARARTVTPNFWFECGIARRATDALVREPPTVAPVYRA
jgi:hypothetical protein